MALALPTSAQDPVPADPDAPSETQEVPAERAAAQAVPEPDAPAPETTAAVPPPGPELAPHAPAYRDDAAARALLRAWRAAAPDLARPLELGARQDGTGEPRLFGLELGAPERTRGEWERRPVVLLLGGLDGVSLAGSEAVLATVHALLSRPERLPEQVLFVALPWASPDALDRTLEVGLSDGRNLRAADEDHDGAVDEDGPDDLDGDGAVLHMLIEDPDGAWVRAEGGRFLAPARDGDGPRYRLRREGRDDDGDGLFNEDAPGGVVIDRNFPSGRAHDPARDLCGPLPLSEPEARALADWMLARSPACVLVFQGDHGRVGVPRAVWAAARGAPDAHPGPAGDVPAYEEAQRRFLAASGRTAVETGLRPHSGAPELGSAVDWAYGALGALALEIAPWGPWIEIGGDVVASRARNGLDAAESAPRGASALAADPAWTLWLDNVRGGLGFRDWYPIEIEPGRAVLLGGWEPNTRQNPPASSLASSQRGLSDFVLQLARDLPRLEVRVLERAREGELVRLSARARNAGALPTGLWTTGRNAPAGDGASPEGVGAALELALPEGARLLAGPSRVALGRLAGGQSGPRVEWLVLAPPGSTLTLRAAAPWAAATVVEVTP